RRREAVETGPHLQIELRADGPHRFGTERVAAEPDDPSVLLLEPEYLLEGFSPAACAEPERERLALEQSALEPRRLVRELRRPLRVAVDGVVEPASIGCERTDVDAAADVLHRSGVQHQADESRNVGGGVGGHEAVHERHRRNGAPRCGLALGLAEPRATTVQRGLHRPDRRWRSWTAS